MDMEYRIFDRYDVEILEGDLLLKFEGCFSMCRLMVVDNLKRFMGNNRTSTRKQEDAVEIIKYATIVDLGNYSRDSYITSLYPFLGDLQNRLCINKPGIIDYTHKSGELDVGTYGLFLKMGTQVGTITFLYGMAVGDNCVFTCQGNRLKGIFLPIRDERVLSCARHRNMYNSVLNDYKRNYLGFD